MPTEIYTVSMYAVSGSAVFIDKINVPVDLFIYLHKPEGKRPLGRPRRRWEDNIKIHLQEMGGGCGDWMELAQDRHRWRALVSTVMNLRVP